MTANTSEATRYASRDLAGLVQTAGSNLNYVAIELAATDPGIIGTDTLHRTAARVRRLVKATFSSLEQEQKVARTTQYASEEHSKRRRLSGKDIDSPDAFVDAEAAAGVAEAARSGGDRGNKALPSVKYVLYYGMTVVVH